MSHIRKIIFFVIVSVIGFHVIPIMANAALIMDIYPKFTSASEGFSLFNDRLYKFGTFIWAFFALVSTSYFFVESKLRNWLLLSPIYITAIYGLAVILYFNYIYSVV